MNGRKLGESMHVVEVDEVTREEWAEIIGDEVEPWGGGVGEQMSWQRHERFIAARSSDETLVALAGTAIADVDIEDGSSFQVLGIGGVFVRASHRGGGLAILVLQELLGRAESDPASPDRAMLFCRPHLTRFYGKLGFREIESPVWAQQPTGRVEMPMPAMWRPLRTGAAWPPGRVGLRGLPF